jgi:hypothetical protein
VSAFHFFTIFVAGIFFFSYSFLCLTMVETTSLVRLGSPGLWECEHPKTSRNDNNKPPFWDVVGFGHTVRAGGNNFDSVLLADGRLKDVWMVVMPNERVKGTSVHNCWHVL